MLAHQGHDCSLRGGKALHLQVHHRHSFRGSISNRELHIVPSFNVHLMTLAKRNTRSDFVKNYDFDYPQCRAHFTVTCVVGHILQYDFAESHRKWTSCDPFDLFEARIEKQIAPDKKAIADNLRSEARKAQQLMIWTDCDREGENIGSEIKRICLQANSRITVTRARFSAIIAQCVLVSLKNFQACRWYR
jgi:DNA topoisomerase IA